MKTMKEIKEFAFEDLELYYFLQKSFNELQKFVDLIRYINRHEIKKTKKIVNRQ